MIFKITIGHSIAIVFYVEDIFVILRPMYINSSCACIPSICNQLYNGNFWRIENVSCYFVYQTSRINRWRK